MKHYRLYLNLAFILVNCKISSQDIHFSQFGNSPMTLNPALTGLYNGNLRAVGNFKEQWSSISKTYKTMAFSSDVKLMENNWRNGFLGTGLSVFHDKAGDGKFTTTQVNLALSSNRTLNSFNSITVGLMGGWAQKGIVYNNLTWGSQYDLVSGAYNPALSPNETFSSEKKSYLDFSGGINWDFGKKEVVGMSNHFFRANAGIAYFHVNKPSQSFYSNSSEKLYPKLVGHANLIYGIKNTNIIVLPGFLYMSQGPSKEILAGALFRYSLKEDSKYTGYIQGTSISFGGYYRVADAAIIMMQFEFLDYMIGLSYDINISGLTIASSGLGGFEASLRYTTDKLFKSKASTRF